MESSIDKAGRVVIPKVLRDQAGLEAGTRLQVNYRDGKIEIEPVTPEVEVRREGRFWVAHIPGAPTLEPDQVDQTLKDVREPRL